jgi:hypothetical protein
MAMFDLIDDSNFELYASRMYVTADMSTYEEFQEDLNRFMYLGRLFKRYHLNDDLQERLILNHMIVIFNLFSAEGALKLLFCKTEREHWSYLKTFLIYLNFLTDEALINIPLDDEIVNRLRKI